MDRFWKQVSAGLTVVLLLVSRSSCKNEDARSLNHDRFSRIFTCHTDKDCVPSCCTNTSIPPSLVSCNTSTSLCECNKCFIRIKDVCQLNNKTCQMYDAKTQSCTDIRKSQKNAFLLSTFLSAIGAANFYIGQNILGGVQLGLLLLLILWLCALICIPCCLFLCLDDEDIYDDITDHFGFVVFIIFSIFGIMMLIAVIAGWWITDLFIFLVYGRSDGNGCALYADLL